MNYTLRPELLGDIFAVPAAVVDEHIRLAGSAQLKVLLWALRATRKAPRELFVDRLAAQKAQAQTADQTAAEVPAPSETEQESASSAPAGEEEQEKPKETEKREE